LLFLPWQGGKGWFGTRLDALGETKHWRISSCRVKEVIRGEGRAYAHNFKDMPAWGSVFRYVGSGSQLEIEVRINNLTEYIGLLQQR